MDSPTKRNMAPHPLPRKPKRSRLSLPSMASPIVAKKTLASSAKKAGASTSNMERTAAQGNGSLAAGVAPPKRPTEEQRNSDSTQPTKPNAAKVPEKVPSVYEIPTQPDTQGLEEIRSLVHAYTRLPKEQRFESAPAKAIQKMTGYPIVPAFIPDGAISDAQKHARRKAMITNLSSRMQDVDACKGRDARLVNSVTQCRVHKLRGGYVEYTHIPTGRSVPVEEFEARYMCMVEEVSAIRSQSWANYFAKLTAASQKKAAEKEKEEDAASTESSSRSDSSGTVQKEGPARDDANRPQEAQEEAKMTHATQDSIQGPEDEDLCSEVIYKRIDTAQTHPEEKTGLTPAKTLPRAASPTSPDMLLPFPPRNQRSSNVLIARAEQKLWNTIDGALATYSTEVLDIQAAQVRTGTKQLV